MYAVPHKIGLALLLCVIFASCSNGVHRRSTPRGLGGNASTFPNAISISWNANKETGVNSRGGGYRVYYSPQSGVPLTDSSVKVHTVPYTVGTSAPTSAFISNVAPGTYYVRVVGFSSAGASAPSSEISVVVP